MKLESLVIANQNVAVNTFPGHKGHDDLTSSPPSSRLSLAVSLECPPQMLATKDRGCARLKTVWAGILSILKEMDKVGCECS